MLDVPANCYAVEIDIEIDSDVETTTSAENEHVDVTERNHAIYLDEYFAYTLKTLKVFDKFTPYNPKKKRLAIYLYKKPLSLTVKPLEKFSEKGVLEGYTDVPLADHYEYIFNKDLRCYIRFPGYQWPRTVNYSNPLSILDKPELDEQLDSVESAFSIKFPPKYQDVKKYYGRTEKGRKRRINHLPVGFGKIYRWPGSKHGKLHRLLPSQQTMLSNKGQIFDEPVQLTSDVLFVENPKWPPKYSEESYDSDETVIYDPAEFVVEFTDDIQNDNITEPSCTLEDSDSEETFYSKMLSVAKCSKSKQEAALLRLLKTDCSDLLRDVQLENEVYNVKHPVHVPSSRYRRSCFNETTKDMEFATLDDMRHELRTTEKRKRKLVEDLAVTLEHVKKIKLMYKDVAAYSAVLKKKISVRTTVLHLSTKPKPLPQEVNKEIEDLAKSLAVSDFSASKEIPDPPAEQLVSEVGKSLIDENPQNLLLSYVKPKHECALCKQTFAHKMDFKSHLDSHTGQMFSCYLCKGGKPFGNERAFNRHMKWHRDGAIYHTCHVCGKQFEFNYRLKSHMQSHSEPNFFCTVSETCDKKYTFKNEWMKHERYGHTDIKNYRCDLCPKFFKTPDGVRTHKSNAHKKTSTVTSEEKSDVPDDENK